MVEINGTVGHGNAKVKRLLGEQIVVQADFPAGAAFELDVAEVRVIAARNEAERTIRGQMPARDVCGAEAEAHAEAGLAHDRFTGAHAQFEHQTVLEPVTAAEGVRVFIQTLILGELLALRAVGCTGTVVVAGCGFYRGTGRGIGSIILRKSGKGKNAKEKSYLLKH